MDVALVTSLKDGMNLVRYELVACQDSKRGVLILREFAGAAQSLGAGAILVNPWNITEVSNAIGQALDMEPEKREKRHNHNFLHVTTHTAQEWAETFVRYETILSMKLLLLFLGLLSLINQFCGTSLPLLVASSDIILVY
ncbi:alpha,alpha-trehalose-phosphate synthase [UDP-forming] 1-like isoform X2 [Humulus lupulus]|uniref:alpha,alpha-trehalose-phosphate synthase [UDP-forming] 1-like isoform X2 n=1 Tax=Humulus lupulus TaxID=3486 RepID=UPI002B40D335|nr:alpha,alpha-trehalose-phosphate synthase [UDP-forming] 1-like isoform X2 [Humulus lupulus]